MMQAAKDPVLNARIALERAKIILSNMAQERPGFWPALFGRRWVINHEPLRSDAQNALPDINRALWLIQRASRIEDLGDVDANQ